MIAKIMNAKILLILSTLVFNQAAYAGSVSRYCPTTVLLCEDDQNCKSKRVQIKTSVNVFFRINGLVENLYVEATSKELDEVYGEFKNPIVKQKLGFVILENKKYYLAVPIQKSKGLYIKEKDSSKILAPGEKENGSEWDLVCQG